MSATTTHVEDRPADGPTRPTIRVALTGNATIAPLTRHLRDRAAAHGLTADVRVGDYGQYRQDLLNPAGELYAWSPEIIACLLDEQAVTDELPCPWQVGDLIDLLGQRRRDLRAIAEQAAHSGARLVLNTVPLSRETAHQLVDHRGRGALGAAWRRFNADLLELPEQYPGVTVLDLEALGPAASPDKRLAVYAGLHLADSTFAAYATELVALARARLGRVSKCLVLDLDNTLWGGILAETGRDGLVLGGGEQGRPFRRLQQLARQLAAQGVLLAVCSKNDPAEALAVLSDTPELALSADDFAVIRAGWEPKPVALAGIAQALGIGTDSLVFVDDSPHECGAMAEAHPGTGVVLVDGDPAEHVDRVLRGGWFTVDAITADDRLRGERYRGQARRAEHQAAAGGVEEYLAGLDLRIGLRRAVNSDAERLAQLTRRTNQFNVAMTRLDAAAVGALLADPQALVTTVTSRDRFADDGLVGALFARCDRETLVIEGFALSCRVLGRGIESACLAAVLAWGRDRGLRRARAVYRAGPRNGRTAGLYRDHGFGPGPDGDGLWFERSLTDLPAAPQHIRVDVRLSAGVPSERRTDGRS